MDNLQTLISAIRDGGIYLLTRWRARRAARSAEPSTDSLNRVLVHALADMVTAPKGGKRVYETDNLLI